MIPIGSERSTYQPYLKKWGHYDCEYLKSMYGIAVEKALILNKVHEDGFERQKQRKEMDMTIEDAHEFIKQHEHDIENLATDGHPLGRAIAVLYDLHMQDPDNTNAANVLALAIEEYRDKLSSTGKDKESSHLNHLN